MVVINHSENSWFVFSFDSITIRPGERFHHDTGVVKCLLPNDSAQKNVFLTFQQPIQNDTYNCGPFAIEFALAFVPRLLERKNWEKILNSIVKREDVSVLYARHLPGIDHNILRERGLTLRPRFSDALLGMLLSNRVSFDLVHSH